MRFLLLSSLVLLTGACTNSYKTLRTTAGDPLCVAKFRPVFQSQLYKAQAVVTGHRLSGLLLIKSMEDSTTRVVFSAETGFKFFDFSFGGRDGFKVVYIMKKLDKKVVVDALRNDFDLLFQSWVEPGKGIVKKGEPGLYHMFSKGSKTAYYITDSTCSKLLHSELGSSRKKLVEAYSVNTNGNIPDSMFIQHYNFDFTITLKKLER